MGLYERLVADVLASPKLFVDDSYLPVQDRRVAAEARAKGKRATRTGYLWGLARDDAPCEENDRRPSPISTPRIADTPARRCDASPNSTGIEDAVRGRPPDERRAVRQEKSKPLVESLKAYLDEATRPRLREDAGGQGDTLPADPLGTACASSSTTGASRSTTTPSSAVIASSPPCAETVSSPAPTPARGPGPSSHPSFRPPTSTASIPSLGSPMSSNAWPPATSRPTISIVCSRGTGKPNAPSTRPDQPPGAARHPPAGGRDAQRGGQMDAYYSSRTRPVSDRRTGSVSAGGSYRLSYVMTFRIQGWKQRDRRRSGSSTTAFQA